jgi:hypothetical protein
MVWVGETSYKIYYRREHPEEIAAYDAWKANGGEGNWQAVWARLRPAQVTAATKAKKKRKTKREGVEVEPQDSRLLGAKAYGGGYER